MALFTRRKFTLSTLTAAATLPLIGCGKKTAAANTFKIGILLPTSGFEAALGQSCKRGADVALSVLKNIYNVDFDIVFADTESNANVGRNKAEKLITEGAHVLIGAFDSGVTASIAQVCEQRSIPFVINIAAAPQITEQGYKFTFRNFPTGSMLIKNGLSLMKDLFKMQGIAPKTAAFVHVNDTYGEAMRKGIEQLFPTLDMPFQIVETVSYDPKTQDLATEIGKVKASGAELIMPATRLEDAVLLVKEVFKQKLNIMGIINPGSPGMYEKDFFTQLGDKSDHWISNTAWYNPKSSITQEVIKAMEKIAPTDYLETNSAYTFEAIHIAVDAYKRANSFDPKNLRDALIATHIEEHVTLGGPIQFDEKGQSKNVTSASMQNRDGKPRVILPLDVSEIKPIFPIPSYKAA